MNIIFFPNDLLPEKKSKKNPQLEDFIAHSCVSEMADTIIYQKGRDTTILKTPTKSLNNKE